MKKKMNEKNNLRFTEQSGDIQRKHRLVEEGG